MQNVLKTCLVSAREDEDNGEYEEWNSDLMWPFLHYLSGPDSRYESADVIADHLPKTLVASFNSRMANWYKSIGVRLSKQGLSLQDHENHSEFLSLINEIPSGQRLRDVIMHQCNKALFSPKTSPLKELLLCAPSSGDYFVPLVFEIAKIISPPNTVLEIADKSVIDYH